MVQSSEQGSNWAALIATIILALMAVLYILTRIFPINEYNLCNDQKIYNPLVISILAILLFLIFLVFFIRASMIKNDGGEELKYNKLMMIDIVIVILLCILLFLQSGTTSNYSQNKMAEPVSDKDQLISLSGEARPIKAGQNMIRAGIFNILNNTVNVKPEVECDNPEVKTRTCSVIIPPSKSASVPLLIMDKGIESRPYNCTMLIIGEDGEKLGGYGVYFMVGKKQ